MVLFIIGLGLGDEKDITVRALEAVRKCEFVFLEYYTSILGAKLPEMEKLYGKKIIVADRHMVESEANKFLDPAKDKNVAFLVVGDPFGATTHTDLWLRAKQRGIKVEVFHNASIMNAIGCCGLQLYRFGETVSMCFFREKWRPDSFYDKIVTNVAAKLHTLVLLDIKVKEPDFEAMKRNEIKFLPPRFMSTNCAIEQLLEVEEKRQQRAYSPATKCVALARVGQTTQKIAYGSMADLLTEDMGPPLHALIIVGETHELEQTMLDHFRVAPTPAGIQADKDAAALKESENLAAAAATAAKINSNKSSNAIKENTDVLPPSPLSTPGGIVSTPEGAEESDLDDDVVEVVPGEDVVTVDSAAGVGGLVSLLDDDLSDISTDDDE